MRPVSAVIVCVGLAGCGDDGGDGDAAGAATVEIPGFEFSPSPVTVGVDQAVVWSNVHDQAHTATGTGSFAWDTGIIGAGASAAGVRFTEAGTFAYRCALHPFMEGVVEVTEDRR